MVNAENMQKWVDALRSGEYPQSRSALHNTQQVSELTPVGYCCLGVACAISGVTKRRVIGSMEEFDGQGAVLPKSVQEWLGINTDAPWVDDDEGRRHSLMALNDYGADFFHIADLIQKTYL